MVSKRLLRANPTIDFNLLPGIADLGVDILDVDHMVDMATVRKAVGKKTAIAGNMDPVSILKDGTPEEVRKAIADAYSKVGNPYIVNAGCEVPAGTPAENLRAFCEPMSCESKYEYAQLLARDGLKPRP